MAIQQTLLGSGPGRPPGRPRSERAERAIIEATLDLLIQEAGVAGVTIEAVAARAARGQTTTYQRGAPQKSPRPQPPHPPPGPPPDPRRGAGAAAAQAVRLRVQVLDGVTEVRAVGGAEAGLSRMSRPGRRC